MAHIVVQPSRDLYAIRTPVGSPGPYQIVPGQQTPVDPATLIGRSVLVIAPVTQSNGANMCNTTRAVTNTGRVLTLAVDGCLYRYQEPLVGFTGTGGSWWGEL